MRLREAFEGLRGEYVGALNSFDEVLTHIGVVGTQIAECRFNDAHDAAELDGLAPEFLDWFQARMLVRPSVEDSPAVGDGFSSFSDRYGLHLGDMGEFFSRFDDLPSALDLILLCLDPSVAALAGYSEVDYGGEPSTDPHLASYMAGADVDLLAFAGRFHAKVTEDLAQAYRLMVGEDPPERAITAIADVVDARRPFLGTRFRHTGGTWTNVMGVAAALMAPKGTDLTAFTKTLRRRIRSLVGNAVNSQHVNYALLRRYHSVLTPAVRGLLSELAAGGKGLREIHWRELEQVVAGLLEEKGLRVELTPPSGDEGRDIVATGEFVPGEPIRIAVEVKQQAVVKPRDVRACLLANRNFPAVMVATAGRFSAGVLRLAESDEYRLRLFLKDGMALTQWIAEYAAWARPT